MRMRKQRNVVFETQRCKVCGKVFCYTAFGWAYKIETYYKTTYFCSFTHLQEYRRKEWEAHEEALKVLAERREQAVRVARQIEAEHRNTSTSSSEPQQEACTTGDEDFITEGN